MNAPAELKLTLDDYLAWENAQETRNEFVEGQVVAMVGTERAHGRVVLNLARHLGKQLAGSKCQVFAESLRVQVGDDTILYPDLFVTCDGADLATELLFRSPTLIVEVLSPSTQAYDRGREFALYRRLPSLLEYILVDPEERRDEGFCRNDEGKWVLHDMSEGPALEAASIGCSAPLAEVFEGVEPPPA
jgi:Uma2 family endonuclease